MPVSMDVCGLNSIPLRCDTSSLSACLCNRGYNNTCLGIISHASLRHSDISYRLYDTDFLLFDERAGDETVIHVERAPATLQANLSLPIPLMLYGQQHDEIQVSMVQGCIKLN